MSVTFANVTDITIPQGSVTKITDSNGQVLWQKQTERKYTFTVRATNIKGYDERQITYKVKD